MTDSSKKKKKKKKDKIDDNEIPESKCSGTDRNTSGETLRHENNCKKKRKRKKSVERSEETKYNSQEFPEDSQELVPKKKKKKSKERGNLNDKHLVVDNTSTPDHSELSKKDNVDTHNKKHKKKRKYEKEEEQDTTNASNRGKKHKKRKHERTKETEVENIHEKCRKHENETQSDTGSTETCVSDKKHKKKKKKKSKEREKYMSDENKKSHKKLHRFDKDVIKSKHSSNVCDTEIELLSSNDASRVKSRDNSMFFLDRNGSGVDLSTEPEKKSNLTPQNVGQWSSAEFESSEKQQKFYRLLGGMKKGGNNDAATTYQKSGKFGILGSLGNNKAMNKCAENELNKKLESQYEAARSFNLNKEKRSGLGCAILETNNKNKFRIDVNKSNSVKFDDD